MSRPGFCRGGIFVGGVPVGNGYGRSAAASDFQQIPGEIAESTQFALLCKIMKKPLKKSGGVL